MPLFLVAERDDDRRVIEDENILLEVVQTILGVQIQVWGRRPRTQVEIFIGEAKSRAAADLVRQVETPLQQSREI